MWFAIELVDRGLITPQEFVNAIRTQLASRRPLGEIAVEQGKLPISALVELLTRQVTEDRPIGELAIEIGALTREELACLMLVQAEETRSIEQILVDQNVLSADLLNQHTREVRQTLREKVGNWYRELALLDE